MDWFLYLLFNFCLYSFFGWVLEEVYCFVTRGYFKSDGFLKGPFKPMYGFAISILVYCYKGLEIRGFFLMILLITLPTLIEFISGYGLKRYFGKVYWDYSKIRFNFMGIICARFSGYWSILAVLDLAYIQPLIDRLYINYLVSGISLIIVICMCIDLFFILKENWKQDLKARE